MTTYTLTPSLVVGDVPRGLSRAQRVTTASHAVDVIRSRGVAVLPDFNLVTEVLSELGLSPAEIESRVAMSGGHVPIPDDPFD